MITTIPFDGFYESVHSSNIDFAEEGLFQNDRGDANGPLNERFYWLANYSHVLAKYAQDYAETFAREFEIDLKFESLSSPREYNFTTDRIFCEISRKEVRRLFREVNKIALYKLAKERFTSRDGFSSFYDPYWKNWGSVDKWDHNQIGTLIAAFVGDFDEGDLMQDVDCNGDLTNWLYESVPADKKAELDRLCHIHDYLREREGRKWGAWRNRGDRLAIPGV